MMHEPGLEYCLGCRVLGGWFRLSQRTNLTTAAEYSEEPIGP